MRNYNILDHENLIRSAWLKSFTIYSSFIFIYYSITMLTAYYVEKLNRVSNISVSQAIALSLVLFAILGASLATHYYFGYKKRGTYLLAWITILGGLKFASTIPATLSDMKINIEQFGFFNPIINFFHFLEISAIGITVYYLINCWELYSLNSKIKKQKISDNLN